MAIETYNGIYYDMPWSITNALTVNENREYIEGPVYNYECYYINSYYGECTGSFREFANPEKFNEYTAFLQSADNGSGTQIIPSDGTITGIYRVDYSGGYREIQMNLGIPKDVVWAISSDFQCILMTNIPIFLNTDSNYYSIYTDPNRTLEERNNALKHAFNYSSGETAPDGLDFEIKNAYTYGEWINNTQPAVNQIFYNNFRARKVSGEFALYPIPGIDDNRLKYGIKSNAVFYDMQYSTDGITWIDTDDFPFEYFYRKRVNELGSFYYGLTFSNDYIPLFSDEETAQSFLDGDIDITEADNWNEISNNYPIINGTGVDDEESDFGEVLTRGFFSQQYIFNAAALTALANDLFDTSQGGIWEDIKKGLDMFGSNPMDAVMGLTFWPFDVSEVFSVESASYVWFGGYGWEPTGGSVSRIIFPNGYKSIGSVKIKKSFNSWRDYEPYTKLYVMIPYCGTYQLDLARYYDKNVEVRYYVDTRTGTCIACLIADGFLVDYFNGQIATQMSITLTDFAGYAQNQIRTLLGGGGQAVETFGDAAGNLGAMSAGGAALAAGVAGAGISGAVIGAKTVYGLASNNINNFNKTKGGSTSMINQCLPQSVCFIFEIQEDCAPDNYGEMFGYPSMKSGRIYNFSGFLKCQSVKLECSIATENERERIKQMLLSGIYI